MAVSLWGQSTLLSTTVSASPTPTTTVFTVASITGFMQAMYIEVMVGGIYYRRQISTISGSQITLGTALPGVPDTPGSVQFKGELITNDHLNEMVNAINDNTTDITAAASASKFGSGIHGAGRLGSLTNPSATITAADGGAGAITGTVRYRVTFFNLSGETQATADPGSDLSVTAKQVTVGAIPVSGSADCQGRGVYRSMDSGSTWHLVGKIYNNTDTSWTDNNPYTGGATVPGSNTTGNTGTILGGEYQFTEFVVAVGQTLTIDSSNSEGWGGILYARVTGAATIAGTINGNGKFIRYGGSDSGWTAIKEVGGGGVVTAAYSTGTGGAPAASAPTAWGSAVGPLSQTLGYSNTSPYGAQTDNFGAATINNLNRQGMGGFYTSPTDRAAAGATVLVSAYGAITISGTVNTNGDAGAAASSGQSGRGGASGGTQVYQSNTSVTHTGTRTVTGGAGSAAVTDGSGATAYGGGGGGGGAIYDIAPIVVDTGTNTVTAGSAGAQVSISGSTNRSGGSGGANAGGGGYSGPNTTAGGGNGIKVTMRNVAVFV